MDRWERTIETVHEDGQRQQLRLFTDREGQAPAADDVAEVILSSLVVRRPCRFGECWIGCKLWEEVGLRAFWDQALSEQRGQVPWAKVVELLVVNRLCAPCSELSVHEKWSAQTAMDLLLGVDASVAEKDRLYRALDRMLAHKEALEQHLAGKWRDLFGATFDVLLYDLTSTYFEGEAIEVDKARRIWVFDRGVVSEANLQSLRQRGAQYVVGTPRSQLKQYEQKLLKGANTGAPCSGRFSVF